MADKKVSPEKDNKAKEILIRKYLTYIEKNKRIPSLSELNTIGITRNAIRHHFGSNTLIYRFMKDNYPKEMSVVVDESLWSPKRLKEMKKESEKFERFIVTTAVVEKPLHAGFYAAMKTFCKKNNAKLLVLPCQDVWNRRTEHNWTVASELRSEFIVFEDLALNSRIHINAIKLSAKHINPLTGLARLGQRNGSFIYASPKQSLEYVPVSNKKRIPRVIMTTGACTLNDYSTDKYMSNRISAIAENDHVVGALIVEIEDDKKFFFRQVQADERTGSFADLGKRYHADGTVEKYEPQAIVLGDWHAGETDLEVASVTEEMVKELNPQDIILHDAFDGKSISHWDFNRPLRLAKKTIENRHSLQKEVQKLNEDLEEISSWIDGTVVIVKSNHDEFLDRYLLEARYAQDPANHEYSLDLAKQVLKGNDPLQFASEQIEKLKNPDKFMWLKREEEYKIAHVELGAHGDGWGVTMQSLEKALGNCVVGHTHTAGIFRGVFRVGTSTKLNQDYNVGGLSTWTHTHCVVYPNGQRQLVNIIKGKWRK